MNINVHGSIRQRIYMCISLNNVIVVVNLEEANCN